MLSPLWILTLGCLFLPGKANQDLSVTRPLPLPEAAQAFELSIQVDLVQIYATVRDQDGHFVKELSDQNFEIREDGIQQRVRFFSHEDIPLVVGLVVDHSGSMRDRVDEVIAAARSFAHSLKPDDQMFVVNFNEHVSLGLRPGLPLTNDVAALEAAIRNAPTAGQTALYDALAKALLLMPQEGSAKKVILLISDGGDNRSTQTLAQVLKLAGDSSALIYSIGFFTPTDPEQNAGVLRRLARESGGEAFLPREGANISAICEGIARDIRSQYTLGFHSTSTAEPGVYRKLKVTARAEGRGKLRVRTRAGYFAPSPSSGGAR